jgi:hypothetical protein
MLDSELEEIGEALSPLVEKFHKAFMVSMDGHVTELDPKTFSLVPTEGGIGTIEPACPEGTCFRPYARCPDGVTAYVCVPRGSRYWVNYAYIEGDQWKCSSMKLTCP